MIDDWTDYESHHQRVEEHVTEQTRRLLAAGTFDADDLTVGGRRVLTWIAGHDTETVDGVIQLLIATRAAAVESGADFADWLAGR